MEGWLIVGLAVYVLWVGLTRYRLYGWVLAFGGLVLVFGPRNGELGEAAPALGTAAVGGVRLVRPLVRWLGS